MYGTEVWNRDPLPKPPPPRKYTYKLTVMQPEGQASARVVASTIEALVAFELQMRTLGYEFVRLERMEEEGEGT